MPRMHRNDKSAWIFAIGLVLILFALGAAGCVYIGGDVTVTVTTEKAVGVKAGDIGIDARGEGVF